MFIRHKSVFSIRQFSKAAFTSSAILFGSTMSAAAQTDADLNDSMDIIQLGYSGENSADTADWSPNSNGLDSSTVQMSLDELKARLRQHPSLDVYAFSAEADRLRAQSALALPDPVVSLQLNNFPIFDPSFTEFLPTNKAVGIRQSLPNRSGREADSLKSLRQAQQSDLGAEETYARIEGRVLALLISRSYLIKQQGVIHRRLEKYEELKDIIDIEISSGRPLLYRIAQIDIERADAERELTNIEQDISVIDAELTNWVGVIPDITLPIFQKTPLTGNAMQFHGARVADANVEIKEADIQKAKSDFKPDWGVNLTYQQRESGRGQRSNFDGDDWVSGGVSFTVPLWSGKRQTPNLEAAQSDYQAALSHRTAIARELRSQWMQFEAKREAAIANIKTLESKISAIQEQSDAQLIQYESGSGDYSPILDAEVAILILEAQILKEQSLRDQMVVTMNSLVVKS